MFWFPFFACENDCMFIITDKNIYLGEKSDEMFCFSRYKCITLQRQITNNLIMDYQQKIAELYMIKFPREKS